MSGLTIQIYQGRGRLADLGELLGINVSLSEMGVKERLWAR